MLDDKLVVALYQICSIYELERGGCDTAAVGGGYDAVLLFLNCFTAAI